MVLRFQRERKISELKVAYLGLAAEEQNAYQRYIQAEKAVQDLEMETHKSKELIAELKGKVAERKKELREFIQQLRQLRSEHDFADSPSAKLDLELESTKLISEIKTRLMLNNEDKKRIIAEKDKIEEKKEELPLLTKESEELCASWEKLRKELDQVENEFRRVDEAAFKRFTESFIQKKTEESKLDPERELINLILLLNNKRGLLYVRKKEAAKDPTTDSIELIKKYEADIKKLESQLRHKSKTLGVPPERVVELKKLFLK